MKKHLSLLVAGLAVLLTASSAHAALSPIGVALVPPLQFPGHDYSVTGLRASILWGNQRNVYGLDLGVIGNMTDGENVGIMASGVFNLNKGQTTAVLLQGAGLGNFNRNKARIFGVQVAGIINKNDAESVVGGLQLALVNLGPYTNIRGIQAGIYNKAHDVVGFQLGLVNDCDNLHGIQIGLINFHRQGLFSVAPILNIGF
ncbi:MAG: hypothetical protein JST04_04145 [Bdellovibrionales bacterium]|nr:hypothetical protein [Bdellovibrionales bacterium]